MYEVHDNNNSVRICITITNVKTNLVMTLLFLILSGVSVTELILQMQSTTSVMHIYEPFLKCFAIRHSHLFSST